MHRWSLPAATVFWKKQWFSDNRWLEEITDLNVTDFANMLCGAEKITSEQRLPFRYLNN
jgi:hypothetical protein